MIFDEKGNPMREEGFIKRGLKLIPEVIKKVTDKYINPLTVQTPPLPNTPQPIVRTAALPSTNTNLTRTQQALLSPEEQVIASRRT